MKIIQQSLSSDGKVFLKGYLLDEFSEIKKTKFPTILIVPGGGFKNFPERECEQLAYAFLNQGYHVFILRYYLENEISSVLQESIKLLAQAVCTIRKLEKKENMTGDLTIMGLSIGGEIVSQYNGLYHTFEFEEGQYLLKPNRILLCYPVTSFDSGFPKNKELAYRWVHDIELADSKRYVGEHCVPTFIWSTYEDSIVPIQNTLQYALALKEYNIPVELHIFDKGEHGLSLATEIITSTPDSHIAHWFKLALEWMNRW